MSIEMQVLSFLFSFAGGILAGFLYQFYKTLTRFLKLNKYILTIGDIFFWVSLACLIFGLLFIINGGEVRGILLVGMGLGAWGYFKAVGDKPSYYIMQFFIVIKKIIFFCARLLVWIWIIITMPFKILFLILSWPFKFVVFLWQKLVYFVSVIYSKFFKAKIGSYLVKVKRFLRRKK